MVTSSTPVPIQERFAGRGRRGLVGHLTGLAGYPRDIWQHRLLVQNFFRRELLGRFRGSFLGIFWVLVQPIFLFGVFFVVFGYVFKTKFDTTAQGPDPNFAIYLFSGIVIYTSVIEATTRSCTVVIDNGNLVKKVAFPCELLPVHLVLVSMMVLGVGVVVLLAAGIPLGVVEPGANLLALPLVIVVHFAFCLGLGLILACVQVFMRDLVHIWAIFGQAWMFLSPVFWSLQAGFAAEVSWRSAFLWNPLYPLLQAHRLCLGVTPQFVDGTLTAHLGWAASWAMAFLAIGYALFTSRREKFADLV